MKSKESKQYPAFPLWPNKILRSAELRQQAPLIGQQIKRLLRSTLRRLKPYLGNRKYFRYGEAFKKALGHAPLKLLAMILPSLLSMPLLLGCDSGGEVLASYEKDQKTYEVERRQLRWLIKMQNQNTRTQKPSTDMQQQVLKSCLFSQIIAHELGPEIRQSRSYQEQTLFLKEKAKLAAYEIYLREKGENFRFDFIEMQLIFLSKEKKEKSESKAKENSLSKERQQLLSKLNSPEMNDADIEEQVYQISEHPRYRLQGGYLDPICTSCNTNPIGDIMEDIEKAKPGKFTVIYRSNALWFLRIIKRYTVDEDEIQERLESFYRKRARVGRKYIAKLPPTSPQRKQLQTWFDQKKMESLAKQSSQWLLQKEKNSFALSKLNEIRREGKYSLYEAGKLNTRPEAQTKKKAKITYTLDTPLYSLNGKDYKYGDLQREIAILQKDSQTQKIKEIKDIAQQLRIMHTLLLPLRILGKEEDFQKAMQSRIHDFIYGFIKNRVLTLSYYEQEREKIQPKQSDVLKNYKENKEIRYKGKSRKEALDLIRKELKQSLFVQWQKKKQKELSKKYKLSIKNELLKADKV